MKHKLVSALLVLPILIVMAFPAFANSSNWSFEMNMRYVDGKANGQFHTMTAGTMTISGDVWPYSQDAGSTPNPFEITVVVYKNVPWGFDQAVGSTQVKPYNIIDLKKSFSGNFGSQDSGEYYITFRKHGDQDDYWNIRGEGKLVTQ